MTCYGGGFASIPFISLAMSRWVAKMMMKVQVLDPNGNLSPTERSVVEKVHRLSRAAGLTHISNISQVKALLCY